MQHLAFGLNKPHDIPLSPYLRFVQLPLDGILPFMCVNCTTSCYLLRVLLILPSMLLMMIISNTHPNTDPQGTPLITDAHWDSVPFSTTFWRRSSKQLLIHLTVHPWNPSLQFEEILLCCGGLWNGSVKMQKLGGKIQRWNLFWASPEKQQTHTETFQEIGIMAWQVSDGHHSREAQCIQTSACIKVTSQSFYVFLMKDGVPIICPINLS